MRAITFILAGFWFFLSMSTVMAQGNPSLAVLNIASLGTGEAESHAIVEELRVVYASSNRYSILDPTFTKKVEKEWDADIRLSDQNRAKKIYRNYGIRYLVTAKLLTLTKTRWQVTMAMINAQQGEIMGSETFRFDGEFIKLLEEKIASSARKIAGLKLGDQGKKLEMLTGEQIKILLVDKTLVFGKKYRVRFNKDGKSSFSKQMSGEYRDKGKWWIQEDSICEKMVHIDEDICRRVARISRNNYTYIFNNGSQQQFIASN